MKHIITITISCIIYVSNIYALDDLNKLQGVTEIYTNPVQAMNALQSTNCQMVYDAYYSFGIIGKSAIPILLANIHNTNLYNSLAHLSLCYSGPPPFKINLGMVCLYLIESIIHKNIHPHNAAIICLKNNGHILTRYRYDEYDIQTNIAKYYNTWWQKNSTSSLQYIREHDINPLQNTPYVWEGYTQYMDKTVIQLSE